MFFLRICNSYGLSTMAALRDIMWHMHGTCMCLSLTVCIQQGCLLHLRQARIFLSQFVCADGAGGGVGKTGA